MNAWNVNCGSCEQSWKLAANGSDYVRQAVESRPCPRCGAYTLRCPDPSAAKPRMLRQRVPSRGKTSAS